MQLPSYNETPYDRRLTLWSTPQEPPSRREAGFDLQEGACAIAEGIDG
jgi:hypothetical protein